MAKVYEILVTGNCSEINGTKIRIPSDTVTTGPAVNGTGQGDDYDHKGAMQFIVATVLVYSICGVLCTLINRMKRLRGKSHRAYLQDEHVQRYLKSEKLLKYDGRKAKMMYDCEKVVETVERFEEKERLRRIEREIASGDFVRAHYENEDKRRKKKKKKKHRKKSVGGTLSHIGLSLFYIPEDNIPTINIDDAAAITSADEGVTFTANNNYADVTSTEDHPGTASDIQGKNSGTMNDTQTKGENSRVDIHAHADSGAFTGDVTDSHTVEMETEGLLGANGCSNNVPVSARDIDKLDVEFADA